eukprot:5454467-Pyramimonas_sp.AAC.1
MHSAIIKPGAPTPTRWEPAVVKLLFKDGGPAQPSNHRPICTMPALYTLITRILYRRMDKHLGPEHSRDQAGFRKGPTDFNASYSIAHWSSRGRSMRLNTVLCGKRFEVASLPVSISARGSTRARAGRRVQRRIQFTARD